MAEENKVEVEETGTSNENLSTSRMKLGPDGYNALKIASGYIYEESRVDLRWPYAGLTYQKMLMDSTIASVTNFIKLMISKVDWHVEYKEGASNEVKEASRFLSYCKENMEDQTWREFISQVVDYVFFGFQINEKVFKKVTEGEWEGKLKWKNLPSRPQETLTGWVFSKDTSDLLGVKQNPSRFGVNSPKGEVTIPRKKFLHFKNNPRSSNPEGTSALKGCYIPWKQKTLAEELELVGMSKDLAGVVNIGVDADYLAKAALNPGGPEDLNIQQMKRDAANLSAGDQTYVITPIAYNESGKELFNFKLTGVDGGGKQYNTDDIIRRKQNEILTVFLADVLKLGQDGSGSFALSDNKNNILALSLEYYLKTISDVINKDLVPQTLALNGWRFKADEMPKLQFGEFEERNLDLLSKFIQRCMAVGAISADKDLDAALREIGDLPMPSYDKAMPASENNKSRSGDGMKEGNSNGTGSSSGGSGDSSTNNSENASVPEGFKEVKVGDKEYIFTEEDAEEFKDES